MVKPLRNLGSIQVLLGGMVQLAISTKLPTRERFKLYLSDRTDNVTIRGMTFTGELYVDPILGGK